MKIVRSPSRFLCEVCSSSRSTNQLIYPFYCFKGSFDRFELTFRTFEDVFHCSVIKDFQNFRGCVSLFSYQGSLRFSGAIPASAATCSVYHKHLRLSRTFFIFLISFRNLCCLGRISVLSELLYPITSFCACQQLFFILFSIRSLPCVFFSDQNPKGFLLRKQLRDSENLSRRCRHLSFSASFYILSQHPFSVKVFFILL